MSDNQLFQTPVGRLSYPALFEKNGYEGNTPKYEATFIFDEEAQATPEFQAIVTEVQRLIDKHYGGELPENSLNPFHKGEGKGKRPAGGGDPVFPAGYRPGVIYIKARTDHQPELVDLSGVEVKNPRDLYPGCFVRAFISVYQFDKGRGGISFGLTSVQKCYDGEPFSAVSRPMKDAYGPRPDMPEGARSATAPSAGAAGGKGLLD